MKKLNPVLSLCMLACMCSCAVLPVKQQKIVGQFAGISESINTDTINDIRVLIVHGVGPQDTTYSQKLIPRLVKELTGKKFSDSLSQDIRCLGTNEGCITIDKYKIGENNLTFYTVLWSDVTSRYKEWLRINHEETKARRCLANNALKKNITNDRLSDFVLYTAIHFKNNLRKPIYAALDSIYKDSEQLDNKYEDKTLNKSIYTITGSLGTKIVLDVLSDYKDESTANTKKADIHALVSENLRGMYMLTNQVPLLSLYYLRENDNMLNDSLYYIYQNYCGICNFLENNHYFDNAGRTASFKKIDYVGFYDPNDLLGYRLLSQEPDCPPYIECSNCAKHINKVDCIVNNAIPWFGLFENPQGAHVNVWTNKKITKLIANGHNK